MHFKEFFVIIFVNASFSQYIPVFALVEKDICSYQSNEQINLNCINGEQYLLHVSRISNCTERWKKCTVDLSTSSGYVIYLRFIYNNTNLLINLSEETKQLEIPNRSTNTELSPCERIGISETIMWNQTTWKYCPQQSSLQSLQHEYLSLTNKVRLHLHYLSSEAIKGHSPFTIQYESKVNLHEVNGEIVEREADHWPLLSDMEISTPYFPIDYPLDYNVKYIIGCKNSNCQLRMDFSDFQIGSNSVLMIKNSNQKLLYIYNQQNPPPTTIFMSNVNQNLIHIEFFANNTTGLGFRAELYFRQANLSSTRRNNFSFKDCGGILNEPGGSIELDENLNQEHFHCVWIIRSSDEPAFNWTHIYLRIEDRSKFAIIEINPNAKIINKYLNVNKLSRKRNESEVNPKQQYNTAELVIRKGFHSQGEILEDIHWPYNYQYKIHHNTAEYIIPKHSAYYIQFQGQLPSEFINLYLVYSFYKEFNCDLKTEFLCNNNRCVSMELYCDNFNHCGDNSDELQSCNLKSNAGSLTLNEESFNAMMANNKLPNLFIFLILIVIFAFIGWFIIIHKLSVGLRYHQHSCHTNALSRNSNCACQHHRDFSRLQTVSESLACEETEEEMNFEEPPPIYDPPPSYDEIIKVGMDDQMIQTA